MASLTLPNHYLPTLLRSHSPNYPSSQNLSLSSTPSNSQFFGLKLSHSPSSSIPSYSFLRTSIFAKVSKGSSPPNFTLKDQNGKNVTLSSFKGKPVVVYFYPADETPGCTKQVNTHNVF
uniref:Peroxiredoxin Q, chloroplastic n=1 Tax=Phaseolus vulgaris TaxID=3885 RepID=V7CB94_PHAVU|nr:hypothetical protein PHAVU_003G128100g [Phaseolus vulgaris]ESW26545.1 hypothetical protein PHAVU_003G128100g [Phaseolus vulgaris]